ncbi:MAG: type II toxin-antitoxin system VapC family toxin [Thaumarchaeota archaeon]|nr:type II toxin-antitoxin system VapC family toxin [Nitrososphaerota archaeon]
MSAIVADASVIVKWFVEEEFSTQALRLRDDQVEQRVRVVVPALAGYEVLNALRYSGSFGAEELVEVSRALDGYQFLEVGMSGRCAEEAVRMALEYGITVYDAACLSIGKVRGLDVYTADEELLRKVKKLGFARHVREYSGPPAGNRDEP